MTLGEKLLGAEEAVHNKIGADKIRGCQPGTAAAYYTSVHIPAAGQTRR